MAMIPACWPFCEPPRLTATTGRHSWPANLSPVYEIALVGDGGKCHCLRVTFILKIAVLFQMTLVIGIG